MAISVSEIKPVLGLSQNDTRGLARALCLKKGNATIISYDDCKTVLREFDRCQQSDCLGSYEDATLNRLIDALKKAEWLQDAPDKSGFMLMPNAITAVSAMHGQRMTFDEACTHILNLRERLNQAPQEINGITVNRVLLLGSALRDENKEQTIGDLDLVVDMGFDDRFKNASVAERNYAVWQAWNSVISEGNERLGFSIGFDPTWKPLEEAVEKPVDPFGRPHVLMQIWANQNPMTSRLSTKEIEVIPVLEARTIQTQERARIMYDLIHGDVSAAIRPDVIKPSHVTISPPTCSQS